MLGGRPDVESTQAVLVWDPKRIVPSYAVPIQDVDAEFLKVESYLSQCPGSASG
jgi:hypothetical protein